MRRKKVVSISIDTKLHDEVKRMADELDLKVSATVCGMIDFCIDLYCSKDPCATAEKQMEKWGLR